MRRPPLPNLPNFGLTIMDGLDSMPRGYVNSQHAQDSEQTERNDNEKRRRL
jgi:hypothetical protein